jgi:hypothetical protein
MKYIMNMKLFESHNLVEEITYDAYMDKFREDLIDFTQMDKIRITDYLHLLKLSPGKVPGFNYQLLRYPKILERIDTLSINNKKDNIKVYKCVDEWFLVKLTIFSHESRIGLRNPVIIEERYFICDEVDGLFQVISAFFGENNR